MKSALITLLWIGFVVSTLSDALELFDVRYYYSLGRVGTAVGALALTTLHLWLVLAIVRNRQWAMIAYGILTVFLIVVAGRGFWCYGFQNVLIGTLDLVSLGIDAACVALCFCVAPTAVKSSGGAWCCWLAAALSFLVCMAFYAVRHEGSDEWIDDCKRAMAAGSCEANEDFDAYCTQKLVEN